MPVRRYRTHSPFSKLAAVAAVVALLSGFTAAGTALASGPTAASGRASTASTAPATVTATKLPPYRASIVRSSQLVGDRVFVGARNGFGLAGLNDAQYPAATTDGGKTWRIDGPVLHVNAANAPNVVGEVGAAAPATYFAYGGPGGGNSVAVTTNDGKAWWRAYLPGTPLAVVIDHTSGHAVLVALLGPAPPFLAYVSPDGGHHWNYDKSTVL
jgi:hypothetical protein